MKEYVCSCGRRRLVEDFVVMVICSRCLKEMEKVREVKGDDKKEDS